MRDLDLFYADATAVSSERLSNIGRRCLTHWTLAALVPLSSYGGQAITPEPRSRVFQVRQSCERANMVLLMGGGLQVGCSTSSRVV